MVDPVVFSHKQDNWRTPIELFNRLDAEFQFHGDVAADSTNHLCPAWLGPDHVQPHMRDALTTDWWYSNWCNPPYSMCREFVAKAAEQQKRGCTTVMLIPSRTDTRWFHDYVWDRTNHCTRSGVELRFIKGRLKFSGAENSAPFPSMIVIFRGLHTNAKAA